jgi:hypothetical protein
MEMYGHKSHNTHRDNNDGTWDSICTVCFCTIGTRNIEKSLMQDEAVHICAHLGGETIPACLEFDT